DIKIGVHTYTHPHLNDLTYEQQKEEIVKANDAIYKIIGVIPNYMRVDIEAFEKKGYTFETVAE
ncbi:44156_t:CDS:2, partial [Gigaspora margarita]